MYFDKLALLQDAMLKELEKLSNPCNYAEEEKHPTLQVADMVIEYESLLKSTIVCMNYEYRGLKVKWVKSTEADTCDTLSIVQNEEENINGSKNGVIVSRLEIILRSINWFCEFNKQLRITVEKVYEQIIAQNDLKRDEAIEIHAVHYDDTNRAFDEQVSKADSEGNGSVSTKDKLLNKTKILSSNLIRSNQVLQSGVLQSDLNLDELKEQTNSLSKMNDKYMQFETVFVKTSQLVKTLEKSSHQEKRDVYVALGFLCICVSWVLWRRIFKLPVKLALWVTFKFFKGILTTLGLVKKASGSANKILAPPIAFMATTVPTTTTVPTIVDTIERAVDEAMSRIIHHDEL